MERPEFTRSRWWWPLGAFLSQTQTPVTAESNPKLSGNSKFLSQGFSGGVFQREIMKRLPFRQIRSCCPRECAREITVLTIDGWERNNAYCVHTYDVAVFLSIVSRFIDCAWSVCPTRILGCSPGPSQVPAWRKLGQQNCPISRRESAIARLLTSRTTIGASPLTQIILCSWLLSDLNYHPISRSAKGCQVMKMFHLSRSRSSRKTLTCWVQTLMLTTQWHPQ